MTSQIRSRTEYKLQSSNILVPLLPTNFTKKSYLIHWFLSRFTDNSAAAYFLGHPEDDSQRLQNGVVQTIYDTVSQQA